MLANAEQRAAMNEANSRDSDDYDGSSDSTPARNTLRADSGDDFRLAMMAMTGRVA